jgi:glycosyltransferase involved in cell wall biosynthesis
MVAPQVSFVVPCYRLAHFLPECLESILAQSYGDFEILIMDDCSPDNTADVAKTYGDARIRLIRNERNLGHIANYNKGISLCHGKYVWLLSADDKLRSPWVVERYLNLLNRKTSIGYAFCPILGFATGEAEALFTWGLHGIQDTVFDRDTFLTKLLRANCVPAPSAMVRKTCYEKVGFYPPDLPHAGDWYMWCLFTLYWAVGYFAEPMVGYRVHATNISKLFTSTNPSRGREDDIAVRWKVGQRAKAEGLKKVWSLCEKEIVRDYCDRILEKDISGSPLGLSWPEFERSVWAHAHSAKEVRRVRAQVCRGVGDRYYWAGRVEEGSRYYRRGWMGGDWSAVSTAKCALSHMGGFGRGIWQGIGRVRMWLGRA